MRWSTIAEKQNPFDQFVNVDYSSISDWLFSFSGNEYAVIATIIGLVIASPLTINQQNSIGNFLELVGQTILTINAQEITRRSNINNNDDELNQRQNVINGNVNNNSDRIKTLEQEIAILRQEINNLKK